MLIYFIFVYFFIVTEMYIIATVFFQAKWLPFDEENLMATCARDGQVRLLDIRRGVSRKLATHNAPTHKLALHPDTPHVIVSVGEDAKVLSIDIREEKPTKYVF